MPDIMHLVKIHASPERVYQALTTVEGIHNWWTREAELDSKIGGMGEFRFYEGKGITKVRVDELKPPIRVSWKTISANAPGGWDGTTISFDLRAEGDDTVLSFAHRGFEQANEGYALVTTGWAYYLVSLQQYLETGKGTPQQDKDFAIIVGAKAEEPRQTASLSGGNEIWHEVRIKASPSAVYQALTDAKKLAQWWIPDTRGESKIGKTLEFWFGESCQAMQVTSLKTNQLVRWRATDADSSDWAGTEVEFTIFSHDDWTHIRFQHSGWRDGVERFPYYSMSWAVFLLSLKDLLEKGKGFPFPNHWIHQ